ncbi:HlyD family secretion protein [Zymomonas mobilis]|uniref:HlyD family secretion protein n=1 Tax=Zymomonas mobilis TaxID=542 RepID=UPI00130E3FB4|nr:HlyD family efflux transporter periplasmic adaptor subunit [Zymomonas mobilis]MDX5949590.1 HlyD family efflux transporter periplasmic adaptor subunit [Zymomonas mobilis subsp. pomaceae]
MGGIIIAVIIGVITVWIMLRPKGLGPGFISGNGRIEATEIDIAAKAPGRVQTISVGEGDFVKAGQVIAQIDVASLQAQRAAAVADLAEARNAIITAETQVMQRKSERDSFEAMVTQRKAELNVAHKRATRSETLSREGATPMQEYDDDVANVESAKAALVAAFAQVAAAEAAISTARSQVIGAHSRVDAAQAAIHRLESDIADGTLFSPRFGRVQYRIVQPGEVVAAGGKVLNLIDLSDVYMTFFLPETVAGRVGIGTEVHIILDAAPTYVIPAYISFVADVAQFTPKTVETENERQKLMFRVKARISPELLQAHIKQVKTGLPGMAYIRLDSKIAWPTKLQTNVTLSSSSIPTS